MRAGRTVPIRRSLLVNVVLAVVLLGVAIVGLSYVGSRRTVRKFSESLIDQTLHRVELELRAFFNPVHRQLNKLRAWGEAGLLDTEDPEALNRLFEPMMREIPWISSAIVADERGHEQMLLRAGDRWRCRRTRVAEWGGRVRWSEWSDDSPEPVGREEDLDYDPRTRPWYAGAIGETRDDARAVFWTEPYTFFTTREPGITASVAFRAEDGLQRVAALDITLIDITALTGGIEVHDSGRAFVLTDDGRLIGLPRTPNLQTDADIRAGLLRHPGEFDSPLARAVTDVLLNREDRFGRATRFRGEGEAWWGLVKPFPLSHESELLIGIGVPESDLLGDMNRQRIWIGLITLAVLALALARAFTLASRYSRPVEQLVEESERIATGDLEPGDGIETNVAEVHRLAEAHDRMRAGLKTLLKIERDLQLARRIQQSTFPERLPRLPGFDLEAWSEPADQTGGDSYDVIGFEGGGEAGPVVLSNGEAEQAVLLMADATGHGIGPALSVTQVRAMLRMAVRISPNLSEIATHMNEQLCADLPTGRFITVWLGALNRADGTLTTISGGQAPLILYRAEADEFEILKADTTPFGLFDSGRIEATTSILLGPGDIYAVISDGIFESEDPGGEEFGVERVQAILREHRGESAAAIVARIREAVDAYTEGAPAADDRTIVLIRRSAAGENIPDQNHNC